MMKKTMFLVLVAAICLLGTSLAFAAKQEFYPTLQEYEEITGNKILEFNESPMLRVRVAAGELPPVEERLPEEPMVVDPTESVGKYGGTLIEAIREPGKWDPQKQANRELINMPARDASRPLPNIIKGWDFSNEGKTFTMYLRKGMKWSDGVPFTADDFVFQFEDVFGNEELYPAYPSRWMIGGEPIRVEKIDDYTVSLHFAQPYYGWAWAMALYFRGGTQGWGIYNPKHALMKYHIKYNPDADKIAQERGYDEWWQLFNLISQIPEKSAPEELMKDIPTLRPWIIEKITSTTVLWERNPYYYKIDVDGNQLPYIDYCRGIIMGDPEAYKMKVMAGELDYECWLLGSDIGSYAVLVQNQESGDYRAVLIQAATSSSVTFFPNQNYTEDPVLGEILRDVRFRKALSLGLDREEINEIIFAGMMQPRQSTVVLPYVQGYEEETGTAWADYDPQRANQLLDEMGLDKRNADGYRLRSDGKVLSVTVVTPDFIPRWVSTSEIAIQQWEELGINFSIKVTDAPFVKEYMLAKRHHISVGLTDQCMEQSFMSSQGGPNRGTWAWGKWAVDWRAWFDSGGKGGTEPPEWATRLFTLFDLLPHVPDEQRIAAIREIGQIGIDHLWAIGTIGAVGPTSPGMVKNDIGNFPPLEVAYGGSAEANSVANLRTYLFFWK